MPSIGLEDIRHYVKLFAFPIILITIVTLTYLPAMHAPAPDEVPIALVGPAEMVNPLAESLQAGVGDQFSVSVLPDAAAARSAVAQRDVTAALVLSTTVDDRTVGDAYWNAPTLPAAQHDAAAAIYVASAGGPALVTGGLAPLQNLAAQLSTPVMVRDLVPLAASDQAGNGQMWFALAVTLGAYVGVTMLGTISPDLLNLRKLGVALPAFGLFLGVLSSVLLSFVFDSIGANLPLLIVTAMLNVTAVGLGAAAISRVVGRLATPVVMFVFVGLGLTSSGAAIPTQFVPDFYQFFSPLMPYGATSRAVRSIIYFDNANLWQDWLILAGWIVAMVAVNLLLNRWKPLPNHDIPTVISTVSAPSAASAGAI